MINQVTDTGSAVIRVTPLGLFRSVITLRVEDIVLIERYSLGKELTRIRCINGDRYLVRESISQLTQMLESQSQAALITSIRNKREH